MARYFQFDTNNFDYPIRADVTKRVEYFEDFVLTGGRDKRVYGLVRTVPQITVSYDVNGLKFLQYVLGTISGSTVSVASTVPIATYKVTVDSDSLSVTNAKVDSWELTIEEGSPVRAEFTAIGQNLSSAGASSYPASFDVSPVLPSQCTLNINGSPNTLWNRIQITVSNAIEPLCKTNTYPVDLREQGLAITGRLRAPSYNFNWAAEGSIDLILGTIGTISLGIVKFSEIPPRVTGFDLPETELAFTAYPGTVSGQDAIKAVVGTKW